MSNYFNSLIGKRWGALPLFARQDLLKGAICINGETGNEKIGEGECIIDLHCGLSIVGSLEEHGILIHDNAKIYDPSN